MRIGAMHRKWGMLRVPPNHDVLNAATGDTELSSGTLRIKRDETIFNGAAA